ncbi:MAG: metal-dependent hydrolase [Chloroflexota bacterium]
MQTYSHWFITKVLQVKLHEQKPGSVHSTALLLGSFMPDVPLFILTVGFIIQRRWLNPPPLDEGMFGAAYDALYFGNPWWITLHNLLHAPLLILLYALLGLWMLRRGWAWGFALCWFAAGCGLHAFLDILTHVTDGPLLFFPFNWTYRFPAPISYWDPRYGARLFSPIEHTLDGVIFLWLLVRWYRQRRTRKGGVTNGA